MIKCIGFGEKEGKCANTNNAQYKSSYWCDKCEKVRREYMRKQLDDIKNSFADKDSATNQ